MQQLLFYNYYLSPAWFFSVVFIIVYRVSPSPRPPSPPQTVRKDADPALSPSPKNEQYGSGLSVSDPDEIRTAVLFLWLLAEPVRLWTGYSGNLKENVSAPCTPLPLPLSLFLSGRRRRRRRRRKCADCNTFLEGSDPPGLLAPHLLREHPGLLLLLLRPDGHQALRQRDQHHGFGHAPAGARHRRLRGKWSINPRLLTTRCPRATPDIPHLSLSSWRTKPCRPPRSCAASRESTTWKNTRLRWRRFTQTEIPRRRLGGGHCNDKTDSRVDLAPPECTSNFGFVYLRVRAKTKKTQKKRHSFVTGKGP